MYLAKVYVTLKPTVNDPQGRTVMGGLKSLGFVSVADVRVGKYLEVRLQDADRPQAEARVREMCEKLLANPVIEQYRYEVVEV
ncbi:MAG: phosphoribosylformylglycinamidine synthase subunit PurS [Chloroflexi bacterium]|nr:phosphoribosylformylglycinamidine synthase subunit PurS [Chloroflexota bacterium]